MPPCMTTRPGNVKLQSAHISSNVIWLIWPLALQQNSSSRNRSHSITPCESCICICLLALSGIAALVLHLCIICVTLFWASGVSMLCTRGSESTDNSQLSLYMKLHELQNIVTRIPSP